MGFNIVKGEPDPPGRFILSSYILHRYGGLSWQNWVKECLEAQVVSLLGAKNLASMRGKGKLNHVG